MNKEKMVVAYTRLSEDDIVKDGNYSKSIYNQLNEIKEFAKRLGLTIDKEYIDDGYSGINFDRPAFEKMKQAIEEEKIAIIITKDMSRLGREFIETAYYISEYFPKNNIRYIAINDGFDSNNDEDSHQNIMVSIRSIINDRYVKDSSMKRTQVAISKTEHNEFIGFIAPYGYKIVKHGKTRTLEIDEYSSNIVKRIFTSIASGKTRKEVADELNNEQVIPPILYMNMTPSKDKKYYNDWSDKIIYRMLKNKTYIGSLVVRKSIKKNYKDRTRTYIPVRDREVKENVHQAIISDSLFNEANSKIKTIKRKEKNNYDGTFSRLVICGECGRVMTACRTQKENGNIKYYFSCTKVKDRKKCPNRVIYDSKLRSIVESTVKELINTFVDEKDIVNSVSKTIMAKQRYNLKISNIEKDIEVHNTNIRNLYLQKTKGEITLDEFVKLKTQETDIRVIQEQELNELIAKNNLEEKQSTVLDYYNKFINGDIFLKDYIKDLIEKITINKDNTIQIVFKFGVSDTKTIHLY